MPRPITITRIVVTRYQYAIADRAMDPIKRLDMLYQPGGTVSSGGRMAPGGDGILTIETDAGVKGQVPGAIDAAAAHYLLGRDALARHTIWHDLKRFYRGKGNAPPGAVDVALWDIAGQVYHAPIWELLGGWRTKVPAYASSFHGDDAGGLTRPEDFAEFALRCKEEYGYPAFKIHGWVNGPVSRDAAAVVAIRKAVGEDMDLMCDPAGAFRTFDEVLRVGYACDAANYLWLEDPFPGGGLSMAAHQKLKGFIKTPLLTGEHNRGLEANGHVDVPQGPGVLPRPDAGGSAWRGPESPPRSSRGAPASRHR